MSPLKSLWHLKVNLTGLQQTDLKLWLTLILLKVMVDTKDLKGLGFNPGTDGGQ